MRFGLIIILILISCLNREIDIYHPVTLKKIHFVKLNPVTNFTVYDEEPFSLERSVRRLLRQRYNLSITSKAEKADVRLKLSFIDFRRGALPQARDRDIGRTLTVLAELNLMDTSDKVLASSRLSESETFQDLRSGDFETARNALLDRLAERLVVDLLEF